ncbi:hypothetical protein Pst134EA_013943 [Puccinia striiformis f. sp. tritici]|uniref:hypothetical protein n=1 Tax=Puccinia striiformis f. sp. tritici TaxID=168172 RepID=UPI0020081512|nr:hypothetical protein Pst134EA_013943 [Puccinia striiformis f. sp. tritici]KAH9466097.1 hypothetical protein Pst134EA_013943 [Puccinia striiformis f. sp. tritici]
MVRIPLNILARGSSVGTQQTAGTTPGPDRDPPNATSPLVSDPLASLLASPVLDPIHWVELTTNFKLYIADRNRARRRIWRPHSPADKFTIILPTGPGRPSFAEFHVLVANRCNDAVAGTESLIVDSLESGSNDIKWAVTVRGTKEYKKATLINTEHLYNTWVNLLHRQKQTEATLDLKMANPTAAERRAHNESLLTRQTLARAATTARAQNSQNRDNDDVEVSDVEGEDFDAVNVHVNRLYALHRFDATYDRDFPVYIDPGNTRRYILLTVGNCQIWAQALLQQEQGVSLHSPPRSLSVHSHAIRDMESIIEILDANGLTSYTLFKSSHLTNDALAALNINLGVVTSLRTNVARYKRYLILNQPINVPASHSTPSSSALTLTS